MQSRVGLWGGSCAVRLPKMAVESLGFYEGEMVNLSIEKGALVLRPSKPHYDLALLVAEAKDQIAPDPLDDAPLGDEAL